MADFFSCRTKALNVTLVCEPLLWLSRIVGSLFRMSVCLRKYALLRFVHMLLLLHLT